MKVPQTRHLLRKIKAVNVKKEKLRKEKHLQTLCSKAEENSAQPWPSEAETSELISGGKGSLEKTKHRDLTEDDEKLSGNKCEKEGQNEESMENIVALPGVEAGSVPFDSLQHRLSDRTYRAIQQMGFTFMTDVQAVCIPSILDGKDLRATAKTGGGKTLAFLIPCVELLSKLRFKPRLGTGCIILSPTRELALQTYGVMKDLLQFHSQTHGTLIGGLHKNLEVMDINRGLNFVVATPGRLLDHLQKTPSFLVKNLAALVVDEADRIFDIGFEEEMKLIAKLLPQRRQTMLFSATRDEKTDRLADLLLKANPLYFDVSCDVNRPTVDTLEEMYILYPMEKKFLILFNFLRRNRDKKIMVFFVSCKCVQFYSDFFNYIDLPVTGIHKGLEKEKRLRAYFSFCRADKGIMFCTDIAARGWDIPEVDWVIQYDPPNDPRDYIHRVGRTARCGAPGKAVLFLLKEEIGFVNLLREQHVDIRPMDISWDTMVDIMHEYMKLRSQNYYFDQLAKEALEQYLFSYRSFYRMKHIFNPKNLSETKVARNFGYPRTPYVRRK